MLKRTECWLVLVPTYSNYKDPRTGNKDVKSFRVAKVLQTKPARTQLGTNGVAARMTVEVDSAIFQPIVPEISVSVPVDITQEVVASADPVEINVAGKALRRA